MKKIALFVLIAFVAYSCTKTEPVTISGKITNSNQKTVLLHIDVLDLTDTLTLAEDGTFSTQLNLDEEHLATLNDGNFIFTLFLTPGATINIDYDVEAANKEETDAVQITGEGSEPSALIDKLENNSMNYGIVDLLKMPVDSFSMIMSEEDKKWSDAIEAFEVENNLSEKFVSLVSLKGKVDLAQKYNYYIRLHNRYAPADTTPIPVAFQAYVDEVPLDDYEAFNELRDYKFYVISGIQQEINAGLMEDSTLTRGSGAYYNASIDKVIALDVPEEVKNEIGNSTLSSYTYMPDSIQEIYRARYKELLTKDSYTKKFEEIVAVVDKTKSGTIAPSFNYEDINGDMISSESLKGKVVYIDVWATWCGPCRGEIPSLKKMEAELHDKPVAFVSISIDDDKDAWEKMVKEDELGGLQLFAEGAWQSDITKAYAIRGIPRFIIIDKEGKIVNANASRPSNPKTKEKLLELAAM
ncbi:TlpA disulfide reductase family protein [Maribellus mangrovi]|uniref:TlpA disulfide reductase family protein n=1 Tax=Maribellus mangrovi TaxID=3133146 RepID=UPI0030EB2433